MAGKAKIRIEGEDATAAAWRSAVGRANANAKAMGHAFETAFAGVSIAALAEVVKASAEFGDQLQKASIKAGIGGKAMSELAYAAKLADVDISGLSTGLKKMQVALSEAATGNKQTKGAFDALGISLEQIQKLRPEDQFELIGDRISKLISPADRARAATELFGKAGADLLPLFEQGAAGIQKAREEAEKLGISLDGDAIKRLSELEDAGKRLGAAWHGFAAVLTSEVAPGLTHVLDSLSGTRTAELEQQIAFLKKVQGEGFVSINPLGKAGAYKDIGTGIFSAQEGQAMLEKLQAQLDLIEGSKFNLGGRGVHQNVPGYNASDAAAKAAEASKKAAAASEKEMAKFIDGYHQSLLAMNADIDSESDAMLKRDGERWMERQDDANAFYDDYLKREKEAEVLREESAKRLGMLFKDTILSAFDDMVAGTKIRWSEMLKYLALQTARAGLVRLLDSAFTPKTAAAGGKHGFWSSVGDVVSSLFSSGHSGTVDGKASGGAVAAGSMHLVGERGPELALFGRSANIVPNNRLGGSVTIAPVYHINNPDNTERLPAILRENNRRLVDSLARAGMLHT